jgi:RHS repeat-associated protein
LPDQTIEQYGPLNKLISVTDRNGNVSRYQYDSVGRFTKFTDPVGLETTLTYSQGSVEITDPAARTTRLSLDANGNLIRITDPDGASRQWRYDSQHRMTGETDQLGNIETSNYGFHGRVTDVVRKDGSRRQYAPIDIQGLFPPEQTTADPIATPLSNPVAGRIPLPESTFVDINGNTKRSKLDSRGQVVSARDNHGALPSVIRDADNLPVEVKDANGNSTRFTYGDNGNVLTKSVDLGVSQTSFGSAMQFDGIDDHVQVEDSPILRPTDVTLEVWASFSSIPSIAILIGKTVGSSTHDSYNIWYQNGELRGFISDGSQFNVVSMPWRPEIGRWYHVAYTFDDAANSQVLYIDGAAVATAAATVSIAYDSHPLLIGREIDDERLQYSFPGSMDEVRVWSVARKPEDIRRDMRRPLVGNEAGLIAYYQFNESSTDAVLDSTANRLNGTIPTNGPVYVSSSAPEVQPIPSPSGLVSWWSGDGYANDIVVSNNGTLRNGAGFTPGIDGLAFAFDGQNDVVTISDAPDGSLDVAGDLTINAWINPTVIGGDQRTIVSKRPSSGTNDAYGVFLESDGRLAYATRVNGGEYRVAYSDATIPLNAWTHIAITTNNETVRLFINGNPSGIRPFTYTRPATNGPLTIGSTVVDTSHLHTFHGGIDEVQLFNRALTPEEIRSVFRADHAGQFKPIIYDATSDFSLQSNPNGVWAYGYSTPQNPEFKPSSLKADDGKVLRWHETANGPFVFRPRNRINQHYFGLPATPPPDVMNMDPSFDGRNSVVQWTAPVAGTYRVNGRFEAVDHSTTNVTVILNDDASSPFISVNLDGLGSQFPFGFVRTFAAGDRLQFTVNSRGNVFADGTGLTATIILEGSASTNGSGGSSTKTATTTYTYEPAFNQLTSVTDEVGRKTLLTIDPASGNTIAVTNVVGTVGGIDDVTSQYSYTESGQIDTVTDPLGRITKTTYDALGRPTRIQRVFGTPSETSQQFAYDVAGRMTEATDENGNRTQYAYDSMNRLVRTTFADGSISRLTYDARGNILTSIDPLGHVESQAFDPLDRTIRQTDAGGNVTRFQYDQAGNLASITDPLNQVTRTLYDARRRPITTVDEAGNSTRFRYDPKDQLISVQDARGNKTSYVYDTRGNVTQSIDPLGKITSYEYDDAEQIVEQTDRLGRATQFTYNDLGELTTETWLNPDNSQANIIHYSYDAIGLLKQADDAFSSIATTRDVLNRVQQVQTAGPNGIPTSFLNFSYDAVGNVLTQSDTINSVTGATNTSTFDNLNRVTQLVQGGPGIATKRVNFAYNALGQTTSMSRFADSAGQLPVAASTFAYDTLNRLTSISHRNVGNSVLSSFSYQYDVVDRITQITDIDGVTSYAYNKRDELTAATHADPSNPDETYGYDATGNRTTSHLHGSSYVVGNGVAGTADVNRLTSDGKFNYTYDANGNLSKRVEITSGKIREFAFDHRNRLVQITDRPSAAGAATQVVKYTYDLRNRRIATNVDITPADANDGKVTYYVYAGEDVIAELTDPDGSGPTSPAISMRYLHGPSVDQVLAQESANGDVQWMLTDHLGTVRDLVNNGGAVVNHIKYDSYGNVIAESSSAVKTRYKYTGREFDQETEMQYNRARYYDAAIGRFLSEDPLGFVAGDINLFRYVGNNPVASTDPSGMIEQQKNALLDWIYADIKNSEGKINRKPGAGEYEDVEAATDNANKTPEEIADDIAKCKNQRKKPGKSKPTPFPELSFIERMGISKEEWKAYKKAREANLKALEPVKPKNR